VDAGLTRHPAASFVIFDPESSQARSWTKVCAAAGRGHPATRLRFRCGSPKTTPVRTAFASADHSGEHQLEAKKAFVDASGDMRPSGFFAGASTRYGNQRSGQPSALLGPGFGGHCARGGCIIPRPVTEGDPKKRQRAPRRPPDQARTESINCSFCRLVRVMSWLIFASEGLRPNATSASLSRAEDLRARRAGLGPIWRFSGS